MPVNFLKYTADSKYTETVDTHPSGAKYKRIDNPAGVQELVTQVFLTKFPDYANAVNTKVTAERAKDGAVAEYGGLAGDQIKAGKLTGATRTTEKLSKVGEVYQPYVGPNTDAVIEYLGTMLHEVYHGRADKIGSFGRKLPRDSEGKISSDVQKALKVAEEKGFPSVGNNLFLGDNLNEFLATAVTVTDMKERGINPTGRFKGPSDSLESMKKDFPWLEPFINEYRFPEMIPAKK